MTQNSAKNGQSKSEPKTPSSNQPTPPKPVASAKETRASKSAAGGTDTVTDRMSGPDYFIPDYGYYYDNLPSYIDQYYGLNLGINMGVPQNTLGSRKRGPLNSNRRPLNLFPFIIDDPCPGFRYLAPYRQALNEFPTGCNPRKPNACPEGAECNPVTKSCCIPKSVKHCKYLWVYLLIFTIFFLFLSPSSRKIAVILRWFRGTPADWSSCIFPTNRRSSPGTKQDFECWFSKEKEQKLQGTLYIEHLRIEKLG